MLERAEQVEAGKPLWQRWWAQLLFIWLVWTLIGFIFTSLMYLASLRSSEPMKWSEGAFIQFVYCYLWALATPLVIWLSRRFHIEKQNWKRNLLIHIGCSLLIGLCISILGQTLNYFHFSYPLGYPYKFFNALRNFFNNGSEEFATYGLILLIIHAFDFYSRYREGELKASQLESMLAQAQLQSLKMQLHPHFLFNTLHSISALLHTDVEAARRMIVRLGDFLRLTLENAGAQEVSLEQEMEFLKGYLEIESIRFQDRLTVRLEVEPQALDVRVPNLILQPIVENAIRHGIAPRSSPGLIEINARRENGVLRIEVRDNGPGLPVNHSSIKLFKGGLGLANTRARLDQLYGAQHRFELENNPAGGLTVTLEVPSKAANGHSHLLKSS
ncbi:MAG: histidine kinase [Acidobacteria bacterium]|nr:histidine kinase [Acidobacteriota bacterium]